MLIFGIIALVIIIIGLTPAIGAYIQWKRKQSIAHLIEQIQEDKRNTDFHWLQRYDDLPIYNSARITVMNEWEHYV